MNVRLACFTMSFFDALLAIDTEREYAIELVADAAWKVYRLWSIIALGLARLTPGKTTALAFAVSKHGDCQGDVSLRFPFNAPGYLIEPLPTDSGTAFDVVRCPIADYFRGQGAIDLCTASWCDLDYALAELTDEKLVRTKTLVRGNDRCDFRLDYKRPTSNPRADKPAPEMASPGQDGPRLSAPDSRVWVWVIPTNEELMIAHRPRRDYRAALRGVALSASRSIAPHLLDVVAPCTPS
jgi:ubiquinone biosynthesis protein